jgi:hypothetical protein
MDDHATSPLFPLILFPSEHTTRFLFLACVCAVVETGGLVKRFREFVVFDPAAIDILYLVRGSYKLVDMQLVSYLIRVCLPDATLYGTCTSPFLSYYA